MSANPINVGRLQFCVACGIDGRRKRRHSTDLARRKWYALNRTVRFAARMIRTGVE